MTDPNIQPEKQRPSLKRIASGALAGGISSYLLTWCSMHGVDFKVFGFDSELVKGAVTTTLTGFFVAPDTLVFLIRDILIWCHVSGASIWKAATQGKE